MSTSPTDRGPARSVFFAQPLTARQKVTIGSMAVGAFALLLPVFAGGASEPTSPPPSEAADTAAALPVGVEVAEPVDSFVRERVFTGTLVARRRSVISFERGGKLVELLVDEGDRVEQGQLLARLDTRRLSAQLAAAEADLAQSEARLDELVAGPRRQTIEAARAEAQSLSAERDIARIRLSRREQLVRTNAVSREEYDEALYNYQAAAARADVAAQTLDELEAGTRREQVDAQRAQVAAIEARLADIKHELDDAVLLAPFTGCIAQRRLDEGAVISVGAPVFDLIESDALEAWVGVPPATARKVTVGAELIVRIDGVDRRATVQSVRPELDSETRTQNVVLCLQDADGLVAGQVARVGVREPVDMAGFWTPTAALTPGQRGLWAVYVVDDQGLAAARPIELIEADGERSFIRGTLAAGERVIVEGSHRVVPGQRVKPVTPVSAPPIHLMGKSL